MGPLISCVVALHTALQIAEPVMLCCAAAIRSVMDWPDIASVSLSSVSGQTGVFVRAGIQAGPSLNGRVVEVCDQSTAPFVCSSFFFSFLNSGCKKIIFCAVT